jgi:transcriptional regulator with PAS, ATPase and Fis domain
LPQFAGPSSEGPHAGAEDVAHQPVEEVILSLQDSEKELIRRALEKHRNKRKYAAEELGISERTLYRKIKEYDLK